MRIHSRQLPSKFVEILRNEPESGMGYQIVTVVTTGGRRYDRVMIVDGTDIASVDGQSEIPFDANEVERIIVTHDKKI